MQLRNKYYPYPVIISHGDYYTNSTFESYVEMVIEGYNIKLILKTELINDQLEEMLQDGSVEIIHHIECPQTCYRKCIQTKDKIEDFLLRDSEVNGIIQVCTFLVAKRNIDKYMNDQFSNDYQGFKFDIEKGCIMAIGNQFNLRINKVKDDLVNTSSIFSIVTNVDPTITDIQIDLSKNKIVIMLPKKTYGLYCNMQSYMDVQPVMHSMLIIPALMYTFSTLKEDKEQLYNYEDIRWFKGLKKACSGINAKLDKDGLENLDIYKVSQQLLNSPISNAVEFLMSGGGSHEN